MQPQELVTNRTQSAKDAGLRYPSDAKPGIRRRRREELALLHLLRQAPALADADPGK